MRINSWNGATDACACRMVGGYEDKKAWSLSVRQPPIFNWNASQDSKYSHLNRDRLFQPRASSTCSGTMCTVTPNQEANAESTCYLAQVSLSRFEFSTGTHSSERITEDTALL